MLRGSFAGENPWKQLLIVVLLAFLGITAFSLIGALLIPLLYDGASLDTLGQLSSTEGATASQILKFMQGLSSLGLFLVPSMMAAYLFSHDGVRYLRLNSFPRRWLVVLILLVIITFSGNAVSDLLYRLSKGIVWPESLTSIQEFIDSSESSLNKQLQSFLKIATPFDFIQVFFIMAVLPAVCEEALFRGVLHPVLVRVTGNLHLGIVMTAFLFALIHMQFYTFLAIFVLGLVLGYVRAWTDSLWAPMIIHLINNGSIVVAVYFFDIDYMSANDVSEPVDWTYTGISIVVFLISLIGLRWWLQDQTKNPVQKNGV